MVSRMVPLQKNHDMKKYLPILALAALVSCKPKITYVSPNVFPDRYTMAWEERHGHCYDSIPYAVVSLDLYSEGLTLDTATRRMQGSGYNLYLSDIFVPGDTLAPGEYTSFSYREDSEASTPFTFLPGRDFEGTPHGAYLLKIENGKLISYQVFRSGTFVVQDTTNGLRSLSFTFVYTGAENRTATYECHFQDSLRLWPKR